MRKIKVLHTADTHFSNKPAKLLETVTTTNYILDRAKVESPDVAIIAGDLVDEHDGPIRADSDTYRAAVRFVTELAEICPVVLVRGTRSHDRETPTLFEKYRPTFPIYVSSKIEQVALIEHPFNETCFVPVEELPTYYNEGANVKACFTLVPSPDKCNLLANGTDSLASATMVAKEALHDVLGYLGEVNDSLPVEIPRIMVAHGMITGSEYSSGSIATGQDFEYSLDDLRQVKCDLKAFGHVHKKQSFPGNVFYSGSPGRLTTGETEVKGFFLHKFEERSLVVSDFIETPAREFVFYEMEWNEDGVDYIMDQLSECEDRCSGAYVRFRYTIAEEYSNQINKDAIAARLMAAGARGVQVEPTIIPTVVQRIAGMNKLVLLTDKVVKYRESIGKETPVRVQNITQTMEGLSVDELIEDARRAIAANSESRNTVVVEAVAPKQEPADIQIHPAVVADHYDDTEQLGLFG